MTLPVGYPPLPEPLPVEVYDSHCHLDIGAGGREGEAGLPVDAAIAAAEAVGVAGIVQVGVDVPSSRASVALAEGHTEVLAAVALHPNEAPRIHADAGLSVLQAAWREIAELAEHPRVRAIGETGLDFYRTAAEGRAAQEESFREHIRLAKRLGKALVIHDREAHADVLRVMDDEGAPDVVVMHCFSGDARFASEVVERGWYCSFAGVVSFKNADDLRSALQVVPADRLLVETDAPFLAPAPHRGRPNASYLVPWTVAAMAATVDADIESMCRALRDNTLRVFGSF